MIRTSLLAGFLLVAPLWAASAEEQASGAEHRNDTIKLTERQVEVG
jgi:hypothetical protein